MSSSRSLTPQDASQYDQIEAAVRETERGRWFLSEYARRNRNADTDVLLGAIHRIESVVTGERGGEDVVRFRGDLMDMADAIARTRAEVAALSAPDQGESRLTVASEALDSIVRATERATSDILGAAEEVQEAAWTLRETGADGEICDALDRHATQIYTACSFQDLTAQRTSRIVHTLRYLEDRIASMIGIWGSADDAVPPLDGDGRVRGESAAAFDAALDQSDVDRFLDMENPAPTAPARPPLAAVTLHDDIAFLPENPAFEPAEAALPEADADDAPALAPMEAEDIAFALPMEEAEAPAAEQALDEAREAAEDETPTAQDDPERALEVADEALDVEADAVLFDRSEPEFAFEIAEAADDASAEAAQGTMEETADESVALSLPPQDAPDRAVETAAATADEEEAETGREPAETAEVRFALLTTTATATGLAASDDLAAAFPDLDRLSIEEKIALFA